MAVHTIPNSRESALRMALACDLKEVRPMTAMMRSFLQEQGVSEEEIQSCELAIAEACNNAIKYADDNGAGKAVGVEVLCSEDTLELRVNDNTGGFEWPAEIALPDLQHENGRGLFLINSLMDRVHYFRGKGQNCLVMRRRRKGKNQGLKTVSARIEELERQVNDSERIIRDMAEELSFCYESLSAIFRCSADLGKTNDLEDFARRLLSDLAQITTAEWFVFRMVGRGESTLEVFTTSQEGVILPPLQLHKFANGKSVEADAARAREDVWFDHLNPLESADPLAVIQNDCIGLVHPIYLADSLIGTLTIAKKEGTGGFTAVQANVVHTFSDFLAIQIVNSRYTEELVRNRLVGRELEIAKTIQRSLLPKSIPRMPGYGLAGFCESAHQVGGDFYDVIKVSEDGMLLIIADVMGKGIPAAMFAAILRSLLRAVPEWMNQPAALLGRINRLLFEELSGVDMFITAQLVYIDSKSRRMTAASAGHCPVLLALDTSGNVKTVSPEGLPLGILPDTTFTNQTEILPKNCRVLLYTDGLTEARNTKGEFFGQDRLIKWLKKTVNTRKSAEELREDLAGELMEFQSSTALSDDQTFLILAE
jgi:serine phosphatase RsbU (regulator of sigma subunit)/anti-sigma regulatory factor (Ser/Thr protein kinase)